MNVQTVASDILVVDDEASLCGLIAQVLREHDMECITVSDGGEARRLLGGGQFSVLVADIAMPGVSGLELLAYCRLRATSCKVILITGLAGTQDLAQAINMGAYDYFQKPFDLDQLAESVRRARDEGGDRRQLSMKAAQAIQLSGQLKQVSVETIGALVQAVEAKDPYTRKHSEQVAHYAVDLARRAGLDDRAVQSIRVSALLHDIGKIGVPDYVLTKPGALDDEEFALIRRHPALGSEILRNISLFATEAVLVRHHHEAWDGSGYPDGLTGEEIPLGARILNLADSLDAMLMRRTYKDAYSVKRTLSEIERCAGRQFDPALAAITLDWARRNPGALIRPADAAEVETLAG